MCKLPIETPRNAPFSTLNWVKEHGSSTALIGRNISVALDGLIIVVNEANQIFSLLETI